MNKHFISVLVLLAACCIQLTAHTLKNDKVTVEITDDGALVALTNLSTGQNYASGGYLWRMYYDCPVEKEIQISAGEQKPVVKVVDGKIVIDYAKLLVRDKVSPTTTTRGTSTSVRTVSARTTTTVTAVGLFVPSQNSRSM